MASSDGARKAKNIIIMIGDGMGIAHRTAARIMLNGVAQGKASSRSRWTRSRHGDGHDALAELDRHRLVAGHRRYATGNKANNNQQGVFPDDTTGQLRQPARRVPLGEYLARTQGKSLGIVTTSDVFDATPGAFAVHTQSRGAGTGIVDQFFDDRALGRA